MVDVMLVKELRVFPRRGCDWTTSSIEYYSYSFRKIFQGNFSKVIYLKHLLG